MRSHWLALLLSPACAQAPATETEVAQASHGPRCDWSQWAHDAAHSNAGCAAGQPLEAELAHITVDPFVDAEVAEFGFGADGPLLIHYQVPLTAGDDVYTMQKAGTYPSCDPPGSGEPFPCGPDALDRQTWTEVAYRWRHGRLERRWAFETDWKSPPGIEEMFQPALAGDRLYVPGAGGSVFVVDRHSGRLEKRIRSLPGALDPSTYVYGGIAADRDGNVYYNVVALDPVTPTADVRGAWLVKIDRRDRVSKVSYTTLIPAAPAATDLCTKTFSTTVPRPARPFPPPPQPDGSPTLPDRGPCGSQVPGLNQTPAIGRDGTIFAATRGKQTVYGASFVVALRPNLTLKWATSLAGHLADGCGVLASVCRPGATVGVDPNTNRLPEGSVVDASSGSPIALPDGGVAYGAYTAYNGGRGHLFKFDRHGTFAGTYDFGWDVTPAIYEHDHTYSIITKDNGYEAQDFRLTQLDSNLAVEWSYRATNPLTCERADDGTVSCFDNGEHPLGFEWCVSAPVVDRDGTVYGTSEDGNFYAIAQGGIEVGRFFLDRTRLASYTPGAIDGRGRLYAQNNGELFVLGER